MFGDAGLGFFASTVMLPYLNNIGRMSFFIHMPLCSLHWEKTGL